MAYTKWLFCKQCWQDRLFEWIYKDHGLFSGGHEEWHCTVCGGCDYEGAQSH
jgi:hypothetical protein